MFVVLRVLSISVLLGVLGFLAGFIGPAILAPGANQGPMLGIFITGPLGLVAGLLIGIFREIVRAASARSAA